MNALPHWFCTPWSRIQTYLCQISIFLFSEWENAVENVVTFMLHYVEWEYQFSLIFIFQFVMDACNLLQEGSSTSGLNVVVPETPDHDTQSSTVSAYCVLINFYPGPLLASRYCHYCVCVYVCVCPSACLFLCQRTSQSDKWVGVGGFSKVVATFSLVGGSFNLSMATTGDVWIIPSFRIWDYVLHVEYVSCVITNCGQHQWVICSPLSIAL